MTAPISPKALARIRAWYYGRAVSDFRWHLEPAYIAQFADWYADGAEARTLPHWDISYAFLYWYATEYYVWDDEKAGHTPDELADARRELALRYHWTLEEGRT